MYVRHRLYSVFPYTDMRIYGAYLARKYFSWIGNPLVFEKNKLGDPQTPKMAQNRLKSPNDDFWDFLIFEFFDHFLTPPHVAS